MAQVLRVPAIASPPSVSANRGVANAAARGVATVDATAIEELNASVSVHYGDGGLPYQDEGYNLGDRRRELEQQDQPLLLNFGGIRADSADFAAFFETFQGGGVDAGIVGGPDVPSSDAVLAAAVNRYETNAKIIAGENDPRGETINISL